MEEVISMTELGVTVEVVLIVKLLLLWLIGVEPVMMVLTLRGVFVTVT